MREAVIVSAVRTAVGKAPRGMYRTTLPETIAVTAIKGALERAPGLDPAEIDDVILGCAFPEAEQGLNLGRNCVLLAGLPESVPGVTLNRFCSSGLQAVAFGAQAVMSGMADVILAGGAESMSRVPGGGNKPMFSNELQDASPAAYMSMGMTAETVAMRFNVSREDQDAFAAESHRRALAAQAAGTFNDEIVPVEVKHWLPGPDGSIVEKREMKWVDEGPRPGTTAEVLAGLKPVFRKNGTVTAGNSSQTSDGAGAAIIMSAEKAAALGLTPLGRFVSFAAAGVDPAVMGIGPAFAIPKALKLAGLTVADIDVVELNEAFASQALYCVRKLGFDPAIVNVNGGAIALGHPLGATGAKLTATLLHEMKRRQSRYGVVSMCVAGGIGAAAVFERI
ncbi:MAG: acetyl-CoA acetyltransferase [Actinobacteria bacterium RBG_16_64_13]|nr:MAG: acetyl-CoA acetyltransferase [Actinobacteria bacterium RBG_16_64_13]